MATASNKVLDEALKLSSTERVRLAEKLLESVEAETSEDDVESDLVRNAAWADEIEKRSRELRDGSVRGLSVEEARRIVASDPADDR
ncbi:MAG TPA: addiction module protein [Kofleriaceae bacterium]